MLREDAAMFGRNEQYTIYDQGDMRHVVEWLLSDSQRASDPVRVGGLRPARRDRGARGDLAGQEPVAVAGNVRAVGPGDWAAPLIAEVWREAEEGLSRLNRIGFDDLLVGAVRLLAEHPHRLAQYRERWKWVVVDEFQDTNEAQGVLIALLVGPDGNVCAVGGR